MVLRVADADALLHLDGFSRLSEELTGCRNTAQFPQGWKGGAGPFLALKAQR